jgi:hypothetical protein
VLAPGLLKPAELGQAHGQLRVLEADTNELPADGPLDLHQGQPGHVDHAVAEAEVDGAVGADRVGAADRLVRQRLGELDQQHVHRLNRVGGLGHHADGVQQQDVSGGSIT